ncbi:MAG TPA: ornithine carbamoyltransferase, partial [Thermomicrobiales bacterium]|nr:ornithine carbamoyltransferase [Thermomicrobiales bacterium]
AYGPDPLVVAKAKAIAKQTGATIELTTDPYQAVWEADAVYTDTWFSMGDNEETRAKLFAELTPYRVTQGLMSDLPNRDAIFMHCLPAHRGEEVTAE